MMLLEFLGEFENQIICATNPSYMICFNIISCIHWIKLTILAKCYVSVSGS